MLPALMCGHELGFKSFTCVFPVYAWCVCLVLCSFKGTCSSYYGVQTSSILEQIERLCGTFKALLYISVVF